MSQTKTAIIFGGTGFIGLHFSRYLIETIGFAKVILADIKPPTAHVASRFIDAHLQSGRIVYVRADVRGPIVAPELLETPKVDFIANFAAIHREPGHKNHEYYETNIPGAVFVCEYAEQKHCEDILFTSSISPYGPSEDAKSEATIPTPETAYGGSKLAAELIHTAWRDRGITTRRLLIVRPGVVFGPGEGGNVSRLVNMLAKRGFFVFAGNKQTRKAGIYVKELCRAMWWMHEVQGKRPAGAAIANMTMNPSPSMLEYVEAIKFVAQKPIFVPSIPAWLLLVTAQILQSSAAVVGMKTSINLVRVRKLVRSNNIIPTALEAEGYTYAYDLKSAMADWRTELPSEWSDASESAKTGKIRTNQEETA